MPKNEERCPTESSLGKKTAFSRASLFIFGRLSYVMALGTLMAQRNQPEISREKDCFQSGISLHFRAFVVRYGFRYIDGSKKAT